jgi:hypothetical protein
LCSKIESAQQWRHHDPLLWTGPRRDGSLFSVLCRLARGIAGYRASSIILPMSDQRKSLLTDLDRMGDPLSYTAAVVAGVAFIVVAGCAALLLSDHSMLRSINWWSVIVLAGSVMSVCVIGYFRPRSAAVYLPVFLAGTLTLGLCVWYAWTARLPNSDVSPAKGVYHSLVFFVWWAVWATRTVRRLRSGREAG